MLQTLLLTVCLSSCNIFKVAEHLTPEECASAAIEQLPVVTTSFVQCVKDGPENDSLPSVQLKPDSTVVTPPSIGVPL